jgi:hypothetical protein
MPSVAEMPMLEAFLPQQDYVLLRFGKWDDVLALPAPVQSLQLTTIVWHYARAIAFAAKGDVPQARSEQQIFVAGAAKVPPETPVGVLNTAGQMFAAARALLDGRLAWADGDRVTAIERYRAAVEAEDALAYDEPPTWYYPVRETLGAALLVNGNPVEAERVFRDDLKSNTGNGRSLFGVWKSLEAQGKTIDADLARIQLQRVWKVADVTLRIEQF